MIDPKTNELVAEVPVGLDPGPIAFGAGSAWVANVEDESVSRIDPATRERRRTIPVGGYPSDLRVGGGAVWVALGHAAQLVRINPEQEYPAAPVSAIGDDTACGAPRASVAFGARAVWFVCENGDVGTHRSRQGESEARIGAEAGLLISLDAISNQFNDVAFGLGSLWIVDRAASSVRRGRPGDDPGGRRRGRGGGAECDRRRLRRLWVTNEDDDTVTRIVFLLRTARRTERLPRRRRPRRCRRRRGRRLGRLEARPDGYPARPGDGQDRGDDRARQRAAADCRRRRCRLGERARAGAGGWLERSQPRSPPRSSSPSRARAARRARRRRGAAARSCSPAPRARRRCLNAFFACCRGRNGFLPHLVMSTVLPGAFRVGPGLDVPAGTSSRGRQGEEDAVRSRSPITFAPRLAGATGHPSAPATSSSPTTRAAPPGSSSTPRTRPAWRTSPTFARSAPGRCG